MEPYSIWFGISVDVPDEQIKMLTFNPDEQIARQHAAERAEGLPFAVFQMGSAVSPQDIFQAIKTWLVSCGSTEDQARDGVRAIADALSEAMKGMK